jgi:hypothetical protein
MLDAVLGVKAPNICHIPRAESNVTRIYEVLVEFIAASLCVIACPEELRTQMSLKVGVT